MAVQAADIGGVWLEWFGGELDECCALFPFESADRALSAICADEEARRLHYPWLAFAVAGYRRAQLRGRDARDARPGDFAKLLEQVADAARKLDSALNGLEGAAAAALVNGNVPKWRVYTQAHARIFTAFEWPHDRSAAKTAELRPNMVEWQAHLESIALLATRSKVRIVADSSARGGHGSRLIGLGFFITVLGDVWASLTQRAPSAEKVEGPDDENPPFVRFVQEIARSAGLKPPTRSMVATSLTPH